MTAPRPVYRTFVVERRVHAPRAAVWQALVERLDATESADRRGGRTLSWEPPWRWVEEWTGVPVALYQATTVIRDDGAESHLVGAYVADPGGHPGAPAFLDEAERLLTGFVRDLAEAAERSPRR